MTSAIAPAPAVELAEAKRTTLTIAASQAIVGAAAPVTISLGGLAGHYLLGADKTLATLPVTGSTSAWRLARCRRRC